MIRGSKPKKSPRLKNSSFREKKASLTIKAKRKIMRKNVDKKLNEIKIPNPDDSPRRNRYFGMDFSWSNKQ